MTGVGPYSGTDLVIEPQAPVVMICTGFAPESRATYLTPGQARVAADALRKAADDAEHGLTVVTSQV